MSSDLNPERPPEVEPKKPIRQILDEEIDEGQLALERSASGLVLSGLSAGLDVGFSLFLMAVMWTLLHGVADPALVHIVVGNMYTVGFIFVVLGRSELFTEQTTLAVLPVLSGRTSVRQLARLWSLVYLSNLAGAAVFAALATWIGPALGIIDPVAFAAIARPLVEHTGTEIFLSAVLAGWLMGLLSWLVTAGRDTISQIVIVWLVTTVIGLARLHHVVLGAVEVLSGVFAGVGVTGAEFGHFLLWATLGNAIGGSVFVAVIKYSSAIRAPANR